MTSLLDTSLLAGSVAPRGGDGWAISVVSVGELQAGILLATDEVVQAQRLGRLSSLLAEARVLPIEADIAARYAELRAASGRQPANDLWIAATALAHDFTLLTADRRQSSLPLVRAQLISPDGVT